MCLHLLMTRLEDGNSAPRYFRMGPDLLNPKYIRCSQCGTAIPQRRNWRDLNGNLRPEGYQAIAEKEAIHQGQTPDGSSPKQYQT